MKIEVEVAARESVDRLEGSIARDALR